MVEIRGFRDAILMVLALLLYQNSSLCRSLNDEGLALLRFKERVVSDPFGALSNWNVEVGVIDPCSWFGVECSDGKVVALNLEDLCLGGTLAVALGNLVRVKLILLRNNSFYGTIPNKIGALKELEVLDLGYNNFSGPLPPDLGNNLAILLLDNNDLFCNMSPEILEFKTISEVQVDEKQLSKGAQRSSCKEGSFSRNVALTEDAIHRRLVESFPPKFPATGDELLPPFQDPSASTPPSSESPVPSPTPSPSPDSDASPPSPAESSSVQAKRSDHHQTLILCVAIGGPVLLCAFVIGILFCQRKNIAAVRPRTTGLSGQLQKAFVTGVPKLKRSELETACEDFSNVIGSSSIGTVYKGTLSSGVEIAVASVVVESAKDWSHKLETQFRNKIDALLKVNHKNFVNLLGYCEEDEPFSRMLVFEYASNGTLFEHLHIKEAEHLEWTLRMRITMGIAYYLEHVHQLTPPMVHKNLNSSSIHLTEDYAAKVSDFGFLSELRTTEMESTPESDMYSFGVILFEMVTGRLPYSVDSGSLEDWASDYLRGDQPIREMVDPTLKSFNPEQVEQIGEVIRSCVHHDPKQRPQMREVTTRLREITGIQPDGAVPKLSPLWWAELEIIATDAS
ncbi:probable inactive receptor-like protein kinase At3g56050 [Rhododendron vialii]|uniref:probable inactive receptor-like protein kinase At3g56050 n=1 Tax=Rhododendron vialii TaxID=182163 RepID=UPI00265E99BA|nr:probable inactive receptor-like protein kinase At3g56050 [Rhododendron vialii]